MPNNPFIKEIIPDVQLKPPLVQPGAISSCPVPCYLVEETDPHQATASLLGAVESDKVSPGTPFLQAKHPQLPQLLLIRLVLQTLPKLCCPSLDKRQPLNVTFLVRGPELDTGFQVLVEPFFLPYMSFNIPALKSKRVYGKCDENINSNIDIVGQVMRRSENGLVGYWFPAKANTSLYDLVDKDFTTNPGIYLQLPSDVG
ncbi:hypothetical protein HGM15179_004774 [Zosterops borbonicus]|uniref:Uncharacterized protein n=1 Tax=Zosterops borbonicus TaxID=364589 RepID=A0A8K1GQM3_9PASS|nr:hypothetical protein HGM15179_004774 [Zosterops borbonicus]